ncbi:MAG TPA: MlaD family protein [Usitatibacter sp.]
MSETPPVREEERFPEAVPRKPGLRWLQPIWIIPIVAAVVGGWLAVQSLFESGPTIAIHFKSAEGLEAHKTHIKYKDVDIGIVRSIELDDEKKGVVVTAHMVKQASKGLLVDDTRFWVVRPRISGGRVTGLGTLFAGAYIGTDPGHSTSEKRDFVGLDTPQIVTSDVPGRRFVLGSEDLGSIDVGSPVYFRGLSAGEVVATDVASDGKEVLVTVFVSTPYDRFVTTDSRFWNASGIDLTLDASGVRLNTQSLATVIVGGIAFDTPMEPAAGPPARAEANSNFVLWPDRANALKPRETVVETYTMRFPQSVRGLQVGAQVDFRGVTIGEVSSIDLEYDPVRVDFKTAVRVRFFPERLQARSYKASAANNELADAKQRMQKFVAHGFRAQLRSSNLLTGQLIVALDFFPGAAPATIDFTQSAPEIPTMPGSLAQLEESIGVIVKKIEKIPFDTIGEDLRKALASLDATLKTVDRAAGRIDRDVIPELKATLENARKTFESAQRTLSQDSPVQSDLRDALQEVSRASEALRALVDSIERQPDSLLRGKRLP